MTVAILVPVLARPHRVQPLLDSVRAATPQPHSVLFICDPNDREEIAACERASADKLCCAGNYATKIAAGVAATSEPLIFTGADDLEFQPGWLPAAMRHLEDGVEVVGVNDLLPRRPGRERHATHFLMVRSYAEQPTIDNQPGPFFRGYSHSFVDDELIATATVRDVYAYAPDAHVAHLHPMAGSAPDDDTYRRGRAQFRQDRRLFLRRSSMWKDRT